MGLQQPPFCLEGRSDHTAKLHRRAWSSLLKNPGVTALATDWIVTQRGAGADRSVDVSIGSGWIPQYQNNGHYFAFADTITNVPLTTNVSGLSRIDSIVAQIHDSELFGGNDDVVFVPVAGTPSGSPVPPTVPNTSLLLANVLLANGYATVVNANITDKRVAIKAQGQPVVSLLTSNIAVQSGVNSVTTDGSGKFTITYPTPFTTLIAPFAQPADAGPSFDTSVYLQQADQTASLLKGTVYSNGVLQTSRTLAIWWEAYGT